MNAFPCSRCHGRQRLTHYRGVLGMYACDSCGFTTPLLDCPLCERQRVRCLGPNAAGVAIWSCHDCRQPRRACPQCQAGWVLEANDGSAHCERCSAQWPDFSALGDTVPA